MRPALVLAALSLVLGCNGDDTGRKRRNGGTPTTGLPTGSTPTGTTPTGTTTTTTHIVEGYDCRTVPDPPFDITSYPIATQEDFDFSLGGYLIYQSGIAVVGTNQLGEVTVLSNGAAGDPRGVHGLADGRVVIMSPWDNSIKIADPSTGGVAVLASSLDMPNGVDVGENDRIYFTTYGEVGWIEPDGSNYQVIHQWASGGGGGFSVNPNGTVLSHDEQTLYVAAPAFTGGNTTQFWKFERLGPDEWGNAAILYQVNGYFSSIDADICGNLYAVEYNEGELFRIYPDGTAEIIAYLSGSGGGWGAYSAMRFGPGQNGWERDHIYVSLRGTEVFDVDVGVPGRRHPTTP